MSTCLVTGGAGFIGSHLVERLLALGSDVIALDSFDEYYDPERKRANIRGFRDHPRLRFRESDLLEIAPRDLEGIDVVFHLAGQPGVRGSWGAGFDRYQRNNVTATQRLLEACRASRPQKIVYASSSSVYGDVTPQTEDGPARPHSPYGVTKLAAEHLCSLYARNDDLPVVSTRFFTVYGPRQRPDMAFDRFLRALRAGEPIRMYGDGCQSRDFTYVDDVVDGLLRAAELGRPGEVYNLGGGTRVTLLDAIRWMERATGRTARIERLPRQRGDVAFTRASTEKAMRELGYAPRVAIDEGIARHAAALGMRRHTISQGTAQKPRVAIYSHDTYGLGHIRRNLAIAEELLRRERGFEVLLLTGSPVVDRWSFPQGLEVQPLPPVVKVGPDRYAARDGSVDFETIKRRREGAIEDALARFRPDVLLVDHAPAGMKGELLPVFSQAGKTLPGMRFVLGLRDILDEPTVVRAAWEREKMAELIERVYARVLVYGSETIFSPLEAYALPFTIACKTTYCGYVSRPFARGGTHGARPQMPLRILVSAGGGGDGFTLMRDAAIALTAQPLGTVEATFVAGPLMPKESYDATAAMLSSMPWARLVHDTVEPERLLAQTDLAIAMGGYNTVTEILAARMPAVLVPRTQPRAEQRLRAELLAARGLVWNAGGGDDAAARIADFVRAAIAGARPARVDAHDLELGGAANAAAELERMLGAERAYAAAGR
jgi:nucleoside-diphosphate-sugar epimerase/predicted glycosyltransferase